MNRTLSPLTLNKHFGNLATQVLHAVHVQPYNPQAPITETFAMEILVLGLLLVFFLLVRFSLNVENPGPIQQLAEMLHGFVSGQADSIIGPGSQRYVMFTTCVLMFVLLSNLLGLVPGLISPTSVATVPLGVALVCFLLPLLRAPRAGLRLYQAFPGSDLVDLLDDAAD